MKQRTVQGVLGLAMLAAIGGAATPVAAEGVVLHGCIAVVDEDTFIVSTGAAARGPQGAGAAHRTYEVQIPEGSEMTGQVTGGCGAIAVYELDGVWYALSVSVSPDGDGNLEYQTTEVVGDGEGNATVEQDSGTVNPPDRPFRNR